MIFVKFVIWQKPTFDEALHGTNFTVTAAKTEFVKPEPIGQLIWTNVQFIRSDNPDQYNIKVKLIKPNASD